MPTTVWTYWESRPGKTRSAYLDLCMETISRHAAPLEFRNLNADTSLEVLPEIDEARWRKLPSPNLRSDYLRSRVLRRFGGIWIDTDTIVLRPLTEFLAELGPAGTVSFGKEYHRFFGGLCASVAGSAFTDMWASEQDRVLDESQDWSTLPYAALAQDVTARVARKLEWTSLRPELVAPVPWYQWRRFFSRLESPRRVLAGDPLTVVLWNAVMWKYLRQRSREEILGSRMLLSRLLRIALGLSAPADEEDALTALHAVSDARFSMPVRRVQTAARRALGRAPAS